MQRLGIAAIAGANSADQITDAPRPELSAAPKDVGKDVQVQRFFFAPTATHVEKLCDLYPACKALMDDHGISVASIVRTAKSEHKKLLAGWYADPNDPNKRIFSGDEANPNGYVIGKEGKPSKKALSVGVNLSAQRVTVRARPPPTSRRVTRLA